MSDPWIIVPAEKHDGLVARAYRARGYSEDEAADAARFCHSAARHGIRTHNALKALHLDDLFGSKVGRWTPRAQIEKLPSRFVASESWDGHNKLGQAVAYAAMDRCMELADRYGVGMVGVDNATHYLWGGGYVIGAALKGYIAYANCNLATVGGWTYTHNGSSRLVGVSGPGSVTAAFGRDGRNRDVKRTINGTTTYLIYDGWNLVAEYDAAGAHTTRYIHGPQVDEILAKVTTTSTTFPLPDALGSTIAVIDASGAVVERVYYSDAFGTPTFKDAAGSPLAGTSTGTRFLFTGREWLAALNLYDYRNRAYSAELGRFIEADPIRFKAGDVNLYRYVDNGPVNWVDPEGLFPRMLSFPSLPSGAQKALDKFRQLKDPTDGKYDNPGEDKNAHCEAMCEIGRDPLSGGLLGYGVVGLIKEVADAIAGGGFDPDDLAANNAGAGCAFSQETCECCCMKALE